jgi:hypothetical protein
MVKKPSELGEYEHVLLGGVLGGWWPLLGAGGVLASGLASLPASLLPPPASTLASAPPRPAPVLASVLVVPASAPAPPPLPGALPLPSPVDEPLAAAAPLVVVVVVCVVPLPVPSTSSLSSIDGVGAPLQATAKAALVRLATASAHRPAEARPFR